MSKFSKVSKPSKPSKLNDETILLPTLESLYYDKKTLSSCLVVNKRWGQASLKLLWEDPWSTFLTEDKLERAKLFFNTVLSQLPKNIKDFLLRKNIKHDSLEFSAKRPLFGHVYVSYFKYIRHTYSADGKKDNDIYDYVFDECKDSAQRNELKEEIYKYFIQKCSSLVFIDLTNINYLLYEFPGAGKNLHNLSHLRFDDKSIKLIRGFTNTCKSLEKLDINLTCSNPSELIGFIESQPKLRSIIIRDNVNENNNNSLEKQYETVGEAIVKKRSQIVYLDLTVENNVSFYNNLFSKLANLRKLVLYDSRYRNVAIHKQLKFENYPKLQVLQIGISYSVAVKIIQTTKDTIQVIWLDKGNQESEEQIAQLLRAISQHCQNLKYLKTYLKNENLEDFKQLLIRCKYLEGLYIFRGTIYNDDDGKGLLDVLVGYAQNNLYKFQLHYCYFKLDTLDQFFSKWKGKKGRKPLYLYPILANFYENRHLSREEFNKNNKKFNDMIESYKKKKVIKMFENSKDFTFINDLAGFKF